VAGGAAGGVGGDRRESVAMTVSRDIRILQMAVAQQCVFANIAIADLYLAFNAGLRRERLTHGEHPSDRIWYSLHALLSAAGNASKLFWPLKSARGMKRSPGARGATKDVGRRRAALRKSLGVEDDSPLVSRTFRDLMEHFDERLDDWLDEGREDYIDFNVGPLSALPAGPEQVLRNFDPETGFITFRGVSLDLTPVVTELQRLHKVMTEAKP